MTGQPVTAAIVVARFHRPPFLIRAVSILFTFAEKVCALSWFKERKEFYFYNALLQRENFHHKSHVWFGSFLSGGVKKFLRIHFRVVVRTPAGGLKHKHTHKRTHLTTDR